MHVGPNQRLSHLVLGASSKLIEQIAAALPCVFERVFINGRLIDVLLKYTITNDRGTKSKSANVAFDRESRN